MRTFGAVSLATVLLAASGCASTKPEDVLNRQGDYAGTLNIREDVFASQPLWESTTFAPKNTLAPTINATVATLDAIAPGLAALRAHAYGETVQPVQITNSIGQATTLDIDRLPPAPLAQTNVMRAFIDSIVAEVISAYSLRHGQLPDKETKQLLDKELTFQDFWNFRVELAKTGVAVFQSTDEATIRRAKSLDCPNDGEFRWECLFIGYFSSYYNGNFVDRDGSGISKPKLGMMITNETITAFATAALEVTYDFAVVTNNLKVPVVHAGKITDKDPGWQTAKNAAPTFATVLLSMQPEPQDIKPFIEPLSDGTGEGISKLKLCGIRLVSGLAGDASQSLSGAIIRLFGGAEVGPFVIFGKFSFGDNETMAKLIDTFVEITSRRLTAGAASQLVYDVVDDDLPDLILSGMKVSPRV